MKTLACLAFLPLACFAAAATAQPEIPISPERLAQDALDCKAEVALGYLQWDTFASVEGTITNEDCAASNGTYDIGARIRRDNGELQTLTFSEAWHRDDNQPVTFSSEYAIGENVELIRMWTRRVDCACTGTAEGRTALTNADANDARGSAEANDPESNTSQDGRSHEGQLVAVGEASEAGRIESELLVQGTRVQCRELTRVGSRMPKEICTDVRQAEVIAEHEEQMTEDLLRRMREGANQAPAQSDPYIRSGLPGFQ